MTKREATAKCCQEVPAHVYLVKQQTTANKSYLGGQAFTSFAAYDTSLKGKSRLEGQVHIPYATNCALARGK
ncbi:hypothetical protein TNCT_382561 [Trichonephila clavata]|uniref:Uncharacterized protein n=1 Tax=Trichonephila clavata TaxID=2740835 RepID=A0A8X6JE35_TRICU|nr:hypothetical protein TNCT_382561 [Trichonephila clavata]